MRKSRIAAIAAIASAALLASCSGGAAEIQANDDGTIPLRVGYQEQSMISLIDLVAAEQGMFAGRNLDVELISNSSGQNAVAAGLRGDLDVMYGPQSNVVTALEQGECFRALTSGQRNTIDIIARTDVPLPSKTSDAFPGGLRDIAGLKIGVPNLGSATDRNVREILEAAGVDSGTVTFIAVGVGPTAVTSFENGEVDVLAAFPPGTGLLEEGSYQYVVDLVGSPESSPLADVILSSPVMTCDFIDTNSEVAMEYCKAQWDAWDFVADPANDDKVAAVLGKYLNSDEKTSGEMWKTYRTTFATPVLTPEEWEAQSAFNSPDQQAPLNYEETVYSECAAGDPR